MLAAARARPGGVGGGMSLGRTRYSQALLAFDPATIVASLSDDVTIQVAVHDEPLQGKVTAEFRLREA